MEDVERVKRLCASLGRDDLVRRIDSFVGMTRALESKRGEDFIKLQVYGFLEGILVGIGEAEELLGEIREKRRALDELFRNPRVQLEE
ncbi:DUF3216 domain-containing protein [Palaeococcus ferrophilus]|uniref:DUF3216 domain-containing protein n=1 Tax=Palaeococcus ferrophilus TaxID=83868 RepID=UPI00064E3792|nr:DUF3216 domain-containing protein [Palaeococcus ferrophilus]